MLQNVLVGSCPRTFRQETRGTEVAEWRVGPHATLHAAAGDSIAPTQEDRRHDWGRCPQNPLVWLMLFVPNILAKEARGAGSVS